MEKKLDLYNYKRRLEVALKKLGESNILAINKEKILDYNKQMTAEAINPGRRAKVIYLLYNLLQVVKKPVNDLNKNDVLEVVSFVEAKDWSDWTKRDYKMSFKKFFKWLKGTKEDPEEIAWIKTIPPRNELMSSEILSEDEVKKLIESTSNPRDKAFVSVLYESGCRIGEMMTLRIRDMVFDEYGALLNVNGKTGTRRVRIIKSVPILAIWLNCHKESKNPDAPLWIKLNNPDTVFISPSSIRAFLKKLVKKAGIKKRVYPHLFRHSRATHLASHLTESLLKQHMGWSQRSNMPATYVHLSGQQLDMALLKASGIKVDEKTKKEELNIIHCPRCRNDNSPGSKFCFSCGHCFDLKTAIEIDETKTKVNELLDSLVKNPRKLEMLLKMLEK